MPNTTPVCLQRESDSELYFAHSRVVGPIFLLVSCLGLYGLWRIEPPPPIWAFVVVALFVVAGVLSTLWRFELRIDLVMRRYRLRRGYWPASSTLEGSLDELHAVLLDKRWERRRSGKRSTDTLVWRAKLDFAHARIQPICVAATSSELEARQRAEALAKKLGLPLLDRTAGEERVTQAEHLDRTVESDRPKTQMAAAVPPADSRIVVTDGPTGSILLLPPSGFHPAFLLLFLFGAAFAGFALTALGAALGILAIPVSGSRLIIVVLGSVFCVIGTGIMVLAVFGVGARERIEEEGGALLLSHLLFGRNYKERRVRKDRIEAIELRPSTLSRRSRGSEVLLRTDDLAVVVGRDLRADEQRWLHARLMSLATS